MSPCLQQFAGAALMGIGAAVSAGGCQPDHGPCSQEKEDHRETPLDSRNRSGDCAPDGPGARHRALLRAAPRGQDSPPDFERQLLRAARTCAGSTATLTTRLQRHLSSCIGSHFPPGTLASARAALRPASTIASPSTIRRRRTARRTSMSVRVSPTNGTGNASIVAREILAAGAGVSRRYPDRDLRTSSKRRASPARRSPRGRQFALARSERRGEESFILDEWAIVQDGLAKVGPTLPSAWPRPTRALSVPGLVPPDPGAGPR
jgi:hypothetical protein